MEDISKSKAITRIMGFLLLLFMVSPLYAKIVITADEQVTLHVKNVTIKQAIQEIERASDYVFLFTDEAAREMSRTTSVEVNEDDIQAVLKEVFAGTDLSFTVVERQITVFKEPKQEAPVPVVAPVVKLAEQQKKNITGQVTDDKGEPIIGANIVEAGTSNAVSTNLDGNFSIQIEDNAVLRISYIGFVTQEITTDNRQVYTIILSEDRQVLEEIVVIGYGEQKRSAFTGSASVVSAEAIDRRPVTNVMSILEGTSAGVQMQSTSGAPTSSPSFRIRGASSINAGRDPLIVVDGVPYESGWNNINPSDIESVTVLKDAASTAIYGARGGNGVILLTTKKTSRDKDLVVTVDTKFALSNVRTDDLYDVIDSPGDFYEQHYLALYNYYQNVAGYNSFMANKMANDSWLKNSDEGGVGYLVYTVPEGQMLIGHNGKMNPNATLGKMVTGMDGNTYYLQPDDWVKETYNKGFRQDYNINIRGGNEKLSVMASGGYTNDQGITDAAYFERFTGRIKTVLNAKKWLRLSANVDLAVSEYVNNTDYSDNSNNIFSNANRVAPIYPIFIRDENKNILYDENGMVYDYGDGKFNYGVSRPINTGSNRLQEALIQTRKYDNMKIGAQVAADFIITEDLTATLNVSYSERNRRYISTRQPFYGTSFPGGQTSVSAPKSKTLNLQQLVNYRKKIGSHNIKVTLLHELFSSNSYSLSGSKSNMFNYFGNQELAGAITLSSANSYANNYQSEGYGGRILYDYKDKYNLDASYRRDASSRFHPDHRWGNFFSFGGAYVISREDFFNVSWIDELKVKVSFGQNGNDQIGDHRYIDTYDIENLDGEIAVTFRNRGNKKITWETRTAINTGIEFDLFKGRLRGGIDYYNNKTTNMLASISVPYSLGYSSYYDNVGSMRNSGFEIDLHADIIRTKDFKWSMFFNTSLNKSQVLQLAEERKGETLYNLEGQEVAQGYSSGRYFYGEGLEFRTWYLKKFAGVDGEGSAMWYVRDDKTGEVSTTTVYSTATYFACGSSQPKMHGGFGGSISWKSFELFFTFVYRLGGYGYDSGYATLMGAPYNGHTGYNFHKDVKHSWSLENQTNEFARWQYDDRYFTSASDRWLTKADYLSLQNVMLSYRVPSHVGKRVGISGLTVSAGVDNVFFLSHRKGFVPSRNFDGNVDFGYFPTIARYMLNLSFKF
ncbi:MAG: SusC/RagA family TonB-linked outer membrane protein [Bacteroidales bacterium]|jgi:TonB-linked SusC/RagA family outer membrane protein|nr:SusC/RagA family TonB-linked outer membrane protein [Bacteroidales bacterium]